MTHTFRELVIGGVLLAPIVSYTAVTLFLVFMLRSLLHFVKFRDYFSNPSLAELSLYVAIFGLLTLLF